MSRDTTKFTLFYFCGLHAKPHGVWSLRKHYNTRLYPSLGHINFEIHRIP